LVGRAHGVLRPAEDLRAAPLRLAERELRDGAADAALDALRSERDFVVALTFAPLLRAVGIADGHADDRDRRVNASEPGDTGDPSPGADDHAAADLLSKDAVRRPDIGSAFGRDRRGLQRKPVLATRLRRFVDDRILGRAPLPK